MHEMPRVELDNGVYRAAGMPDGFRNDCKACNLASKAERYRANRQPSIDRVSDGNRRTLSV